MQALGRRPDLSEKQAKCDGNPVGSYDPLSDSGSLGWSERYSESEKIKIIYIGGRKQSKFLKNGIGMGHINSRTM